ncbi:RNA pyrophosphohydrolase [Hyphobacterium sp.]|uniref:RNA pyrophosphohydrolase n=1 Tax=Hyphobacterium sp. TaxID=2004662 RepID=UPI003BAA1D7B
MDDPFPKHRPNAGVVLFNRQGLVWIGRRADVNGPYIWQFPQGGLDAGEDAESAARREAYEETGARSDQLELLGQIDRWLAYDFPADLPARPDQKKYKWKGQKQRWFAYRYTGRDQDFDLTAVPPQEFAEWRWERLENVPPLIIDWKRSVYDVVADEFSRFAR